MTTIRITTVIPSHKTQNATTMLAGGSLFVVDYRYLVNRRQAFDNNRGGKRSNV